MAVRQFTYISCGCGELKTAWTHFFAKGVAGTGVILGAEMEAKNENYYRRCRDLNFARTG